MSYKYIYVNKNDVKCYKIYYNINNTKLLSPKKNRVKAKCVPLPLPLPLPAPRPPLPLALGEPSNLAEEETNYYIY